jgi:hypothetical protein
LGIWGFLDKLSQSISGFFGDEIGKVDPVAGGGGDQVLSSRINRILQLPRFGFFSIMVVASAVARETNPHRVFLFNNYTLDNVAMPYPKIDSAVIHVAHCSAVPKSTPRNRNPSFVLFLDQFMAGAADGGRCGSRHPAGTPGSCIHDTYQDETYSNIIETEESNTFRVNITLRST